MLKEQEEKVEEMLIAGIKPDDHRLKDNKSGLFNPTDFIVVETNFRLILTVIASHGEIDLEDSYYSKFRKAVGVTNQILNQRDKSEVVVGCGIYSAFSASNRQEHGGLGIPLEDLDNIKPVEFPIQDFKKLHPDSSFREFIKSKCIFD